MQNLLAVKAAKAQTRIRASDIAGQYYVDRGLLRHGSPA
jgi:hypothetical protein